MAVSNQSGEPGALGPSGPAARSGATVALAAVALLSGCAALVFETLWFRVAGLVFGNGVWASSVVLAAFMAGLALGNLLSGRLGARIARPLHVYAGLELAIGAAGAALVTGLPLLTGVLAPLFLPLREVPWLLNLVRLVIAFAFMTLPATAMGATLPVLVKALSARDPRFGRVLGWLYGMNTLGAVAGALLGEAALIGWLGVRGSALAAAGANATAALVALALARSAGAAAPAGPPRVAGGSVRGAGRLLAAACLSGALFLGLEVVWFRFLSLFVYGTSQVFAVLLAVVLAGIALGGLAASRWLGAGARGAPWLPALALGSAGVTLLGFASWRLVYAAALSPGNAVTSLGTVTLVAAPLVFPAAFLSGVLFTALGDAAVETLGEEARTTGYLTLANTLGAALGSLAAGFLLLPRLGVEGTLQTLALGYLGVAALAWRVAVARGRPRLVAALAVGLGVLVLAFPRGVLRDFYLLHPTAPFEAPGTEIVAVREGRTETIVFQRTERFGRAVQYRLFTDSVAMSGTRYSSRRYMKAFVYLPVALHPAPRRALLISYGVGSTAKALTDTRALERIDVVDISGDILDMSSVVFPPEEDPLLDPRVRVHVEDGRFFLETTGLRFDLITAEPPPPKVAGVVNLYTREYFARMHERLAEGGLASYWLPVHSLLEGDARAITRAFCDVFTDCSLWNGSGTDWILLGSRGGVGPVSAGRLRRQWEDPTVLRELMALGLESPELLGATFMADAEALRALTRDTPPLVDDFPLRLSEQAPAPDAAVAVPFFRELMDTTRAKSAFERSAWVARVWPAELRAATLRHFAWQALVNASLTYGSDATPSLADLRRVLDDSGLRTLPLWILASDAAELDAARALEGDAARRPNALRVLGVGAIADRDYAKAARLFAEAREKRPRSARLLGLEITARCMGGDLDGASALARDLLHRVPGAARDDAHWRLMETTFGLPDPRRS
ncbi:MAG: spermidine synthase [Myxococcota bacterium]|nr:spermidine synthase [Myxococcota bacterium]